MKTLTKLCGTYLIVVCSLFTLTLFAHYKRKALRNQIVTLNNVPRLFDYAEPLKRQQQQEFNWQHILSAPTFRPGFRYSRGRTGVRYVLGVPTVLRKGENYLLQTLEQLIEKMTSHQRRHCLIIVFIGETNCDRVQHIFEEIKEHLGPHLEDGLITVLSPPVNYYPDFELLYISLHDDPERAHWRTKQNLDYLFLMTYAQSRGDFYLQLEDDIKPNAGYMDYIDKLATLHSNFRLSLQTWIVLSFSELGFIGKLFHAKELKPFVEYVKIFYNDQPIDWLLQSYVKLKSCSWDIFYTDDCTKNYYLYSIPASQSQFQHIGLKSSLRAKEQKLKDKRFNKSFAKTQMNHLRQPLDLIMSHMGTMLLKSKYLEQGETFIWGYMPQESSLIRYMKAHQYDTGQIRIRGGETNADNFSDVILDLLDKNTVLKRDETERNGFIMSYTHQTAKTKPYILYFSMSEYKETRWLRRFWSGKASNLPLSLGLQMGIFMCRLM